MEQIKLEIIRRDGGTQSRAQMDESTIKEYIEALNEGADFPPITLVYDGTDYWLADGFHRLMAHIDAKKRTIAADVKQGTRRDAVLISVGANAAHGLRRTQEDKRRAVMTLLKDEEWSHWSDREIARRVGVSPSTVSTYRASVQNGQTAERKVVRGGTEYTMSTENIGSKAELQSPQKPPALDSVTQQETSRVRYLKPEGFVGATSEEQWELAYADVKKAYAKNEILLVCVSGHGLMAFRDDAIAIAQALSNVEHYHISKGLTYLIPFKENRHYIEILRESQKNILYYTWINQDAADFWKRVVGETPTAYRLPDEATNTKFIKGDKVRTKSGHEGVVQADHNRHITVTTPNGTRDYKRANIELVEDLTFRLDDLQVALELIPNDREVAWRKLSGFLRSIKFTAPVEDLLKVIDYRAGGDTSPDDAFVSAINLLAWIREIEDHAQESINLDEVEA